MIEICGKLEKNQTLNSNSYAIFGSFYSLELLQTETVF